MQFKHPEFLFFLFLLLIPLLIHLFHLQKFKKESFTNVQFLKAIQLETRKSAKLKKLLILLTRLLALAALIFAFAQPFINKNKSLQKRDGIYYLDNSFSMQSKSNSGIDQLQLNKNYLLDNSQDNYLVKTLISNEVYAEKLDQKSFSNALVKLDFYPVHKNINQILLEINSQYRNNEDALYDAYLFSDFQSINNEIDTSLIDKKQEYNLVNASNINQNNISIDSIWIASRDQEYITLNARIRSHKLMIDDLSVSLYLDEALYGKSTIDLKADTSEEIEFKIPSAGNNFGRITISDQSLSFDNDLFFSIPKKPRTKVLVIGLKSDYLNRIYPKESFDIIKVTYDALDQSQISEQDLIILDEVKQISNPLIQSLNSFVINGGKLVIIPARNSLIEDYNKLLSSFNAGKIIDKFETNKKVSNINYEHPFFSNVFEKEIHNFQYPVISQGYNISLKNASPLLQFDDFSNFASEVKYKDGKIYIISGSISESDNKFLNSPLIVPLFYNFSLENQQNEGIYLNIGQSNQIIIQTRNISDEPMKIVRNDKEFIPVQTKKNDKIRISTSEFPQVSGIYDFNFSDETIEKIAYNYNRKESVLMFQSLESLADRFNNIYLYDSIDKAIKDGNERNNNKNLWQLFIIFALVFLVLEILLQKYMKN